MVHESELEQEKIYTEEVKKEKTRPDIFKMLTQSQLIVILFCLGLVFYFLVIEKGEDNLVYIYALVLIIIITLLSGLVADKTVKLTEKQCRAIAWNWIMNSQRSVHGFPQGTIEMPMVGKEHEFEGEPRYWEFYFTITDRDKFKHKYSIAVRSAGQYAGYIKHITPRLEGWSGKEAPDIYRQYIPAPRGYYYPGAEQFRKIGGEL